MRTSPRRLARSIAASYACAAASDRAYVERVRRVEEGARASRSSDPLERAQRQRAARSRSTPRRIRWYATVEHQVGAVAAPQAVLAHRGELALSDRPQVRLERRGADELRVEGFGEVVIVVAPSSSSARSSTRTRPRAGSTERARPYASAVSPRRTGSPSASTAWPRCSTAASVSTAARRGPARAGARRAVRAKRLGERPAQVGDRSVRRAACQRPRCGPSQLLDHEQVRRRRRDEQVRGDALQPRRRPRRGDQRPGGGAAPAPRAARPRRRRHGRPSVRTRADPAAPAGLSGLSAADDAAARCASNSARSAASLRSAPSPTTAAALQCARRPRAGPGASESRAQPPAAPAPRRAARSPRRVARRRRRRAWRGSRSSSGFPPTAA